MHTEKTAKKRKKGTIKPTPIPPAMDDTAGAGESVHTAPPPPDTHSPIFTPPPVSMLRSFFKTLMFCIPTAIVALGAIGFYGQNTIVTYVPEMRLVYKTLGITQANAWFKDTDNTPNPNTPLIGHVTQLIANRNSTLYGIIYNTSNKTHYKPATIVLEFLTDNDTPIGTQTHTVPIALPPAQHTAFKIRLQYIPTYAQNVRIKSVQ